MFKAIKLLIKLEKMMTISMMKMKKKMILI